MKLHRFIVDFELTKSPVVITDGDLVKQIRNVLKLKVGDQIILSDGNMNEVLGEISEIGKNIVVKVLEERKNGNEPKNSIILYCAILKRENFEIVIQKATEVGVKEIVPIISKRTVKLNLKQDRLEKIIKEAAEQSGRGIVPKLHEPKKFKEAIEQVQGKGNLFFDPSGDILSYKFQIQDTVNIWIGPEGGWDEEELELAKSHEFDIVSLGKLTLRAETAAIVASWLANQNGQSSQ